MGGYPFATEDEFYLHPSHRDTFPLLSQHHGKHATHLKPTKMSSQLENADLFQRVVVFRLWEDCEERDILVSRQAVARYDVRGVVTTSTRPRTC